MGGSLDGVVTEEEVGNEDNPAALLVICSFGCLRRRADGIFRGALFDLVEIMLLTHTLYFQLFCECLGVNYPLGYNFST